MGFRLTPRSMTLICCKVKFCRNFARFVDFGRQLGNATGFPVFQPENRVKPPVFKTVKPVLCAVKKLVLAGLISGAKTSQKSVQKCIFIGILYWKPN